MSDRDSLLPGGRRGTDDGPGLVPAFTLVVWVGCVAIGATGLLSPPTPPPAPPSSQPVTQVVNVSLESMPAPPDVTPAAAAAVPEPTPTEAVAAPSVPTVAMPSPAIAFAVPAAGPARVGPAAAAVPVARSGEPLVHRLSAGSTGGDVLPQPTYPYAAEVAGQTGTVVVRFTVDPDGHVTRAWVVSPSRWPLLNAEAVRAARETVQPPGRARTDEYTPTFQPRAE